MDPEQIALIAGALGLPALMATLGKAVLARAQRRPESFFQERSEAIRVSFDRVNSALIDLRQSVRAYLDGSSSKEELENAFEKSRT